MLSKIIKLKVQILNFKFKFTLRFKIVWNKEKFSIHVYLEV